MSTDRELEDVRRELSKLKGVTIYTYPKKQRNYIKSIDDVGFTVTTKSGTDVVKWAKIRRSYAILKSEREIFQEDPRAIFGHRGGFIRPLLAELSTVEHIEGASPPGIRYLPDGLPVRLRNPRDKVAGAMAGKRKLTVIIERDEDDYYVASVPELQGCHTQGKSLDEVMQRIQEAALLCLEAEGNDDGSRLEFVGVQAIEV